MGIFEQRVFLVVAAVCFVFLVCLLVHMIRKHGAGLSKPKRRRGGRRSASSPAKGDGGRGNGGRVSGGVVLCALCGIVFGSMVARSPFKRY